MNENQSLDARIKQEVDDYGSVDPANTRNRDILVEVGMGRRKVFLLDGTDSLLQQFHEYVRLDPAFCTLLGDSYVVFQEYNTKFGTWVDIESEEDLRDGAVVRVMFFPKAVETDDSNPSRVKEKVGTSNNHEVTRKKPRMSYDNMKDNSKLRNVCTQNNNGENVYPQRTSDSHSITVQVKTENDTDSCYVTLPKESVKEEPSELASQCGSLGQKSSAVEKPVQGVTSVCVPPPLMEKKRLASKKNNESPHVATAHVQSQHHTRAHVHKDSLSTNTIPERQIFWNTEITPNMLEKRLFWGNCHASRTWHKTLFSGVATFEFDGKHIKYIENVSEGTWKCKTRKCTVTFWGCRSFDGPNIIDSIETPITTDTLSHVLIKKVVDRVKNHYNDSFVRLQFLAYLKTQFDSDSLKAFLKTRLISTSMWTIFVEDLSPAVQAWRLVAEKVRSLLCSSREEMVSIVCKLWETDKDVQLMCSNMITLLPQICTSVVDNGGYHPNVKVTY